MKFKIPEPTFVSVEETLPERSPLNMVFWLLLPTTRETGFDAESLKEIFAMPAKPPMLKVPMPAVNPSPKFPANVIF